MFSNKFEMIYMGSKLLKKLFEKLFFDMRFNVSIDQLQTLAEATFIDIKICRATVT